MSVGIYGGHSDGAKVCGGQYAVEAAPPVTSCRATGAPFHARPTCLAGAPGFRDLAVCPGGRRRRGGTLLPYLPCRLTTTRPRDPQGHRRPFWRGGPPNRPSRPQPSSPPGPRTAAGPRREGARSRSGPAGPHGGRSVDGWPLAIAVRQITGGTPKPIAVPRGVIRWLAASSLVADAAARW